MIYFDIIAENDKIRELSYILYFNPDICNKCVSICVLEILRIIQIQRLLFHLLVINEYNIKHEFVK